MRLLENIIAENGNIQVNIVATENKILVPKRSKIKTDWVMVFQKELSKLVREENLSRRSLKLLLWLIAETNFDDTPINVTVVQLAEILNEHRGELNNDIKYLSEKGIIVRDTKLKTIRLNYHLAYKGQVPTLKSLQMNDKPLIQLK